MMSSNEITSLICNKYDIKSSTAFRQLERLIIKYNYSRTSFLSRKYIHYFKEIVRLIKTEIKKTGKPYYCGKCQRTHKFGSVYDEHFLQMILCDVTQNKKTKNPYVLGVECF